jgi:hypothetical protein
MEDKTISPVITDSHTDRQKELIELFQANMKFSGKNQSSASVPKKVTEDWLAEQGLNKDVVNMYTDCVKDINIAAGSISTSMTVEKIKEANPQSDEERRAIPTCKVSVPYHGNKQIAETTGYRSGPVPGSDGKKTWSKIGVVTYDTTIEGTAKNATTQEYSAAVARAFGLD